MILRILQVITDTDRRGAQTFATDLHPALVALGHDVETVALAPGEVGGLDLEALGRSRLGPSTVKSLRRRVAAVDVVIAHGSSTLPACAAGTMRTGTPFVYRQISDPMFWAATWYRRLRVRGYYRFPSKVVALSRSTAEILFEHFGLERDRTEVIPNGVPAARFPVPTRDTRDRCRAQHGVTGMFTAAFVAALVPEKGADVAVEAVASLPNTRLLVAGDGPERSTLEEMAQRIAPGQVTFLGSVPSSAEILAAADVLVLPSKGGDTMPAALIEAGLMGIPSVATPIGAIEEVVKDGQTGMLISAPEPARFEAALASLARDSARVSQLGAAARERCLREFEIQPVAQRWAAVLVEASRAGRKPLRSG